MKPAWLSAFNPTAMAIIAILAASSMAPGADALMIRDINPDAASSYPGLLTLFNGAIYFAATDGVSGNELWKSDGTMAGTTLLSDINPGPADASLIELFDGGTSLYLSVGATSEHNGGLWISDGVTSDAQFITDMVQPTSFSNFNSTIYLTGNSGLYKTDGSATGTIWVTAGMDIGGASAMRACGNKLYFQANTTDAGLPTGTELFASDGTNAGTYMVKDLAPGGFSILGSYIPFTSTPHGFVEFNGSVYFTTNLGGLWKTDGTSGGTVEVFTDSVSEPVVYNGFLYFMKGDPSFGVEPFKSDGTTAGTTLLKDINPGAQGSSTNITRFIVAGGQLYFVAFEPTNGVELYTSDGTESGTHLAANIAPGDDSSQPTSLAQLGNNLLFSATADDTATTVSHHGLELWKLDITGQSSINKWNGY